MKTKLKTLSKLLILFIVISCSNKISNDQLQNEVLKDIKSKIEGQGQDRLVKSFVLKQISRNNYVGVLKTTEKGKQFTYKVNVISDGKTFVWKKNQTSYLSKSDNRYSEKNNVKYGKLSTDNSSEEKSIKELLENYVLQDDSKKTSNENFKLIKTVFSSIEKNGIITSQKQRDLFWEFNFKNGYLEVTLNVDSNKHNFTGHYIEGNNSKLEIRKSNGLKYCDLEVIDMQLNEYFLNGEIWHHEISSGYGC